MAAKKQQVKKQEPVQQAEPVIAIEEQAATTIKIRPETKARLDILKGMLNLPDYNSTISKIIEIIPEKLSTDNEIVLKMTRQKYNWFMKRFQRDCDLRTEFDRAVR